MAKLDISVELLPEVLPILAQCCEIEGSAASRDAKTVTLIVSGVAVPAGERVMCTVTRALTSDGATLRVEFIPT